MLVSKLNLVDLAGSERVGKTGSSGLHTLRFPFLDESEFHDVACFFLSVLVLCLSTYLFVCGVRYRSERGQAHQQVSVVPRAGCYAVFVVSLGGGGKLTS